MANYYVDSNSGDNGDNGTTQALAWATIEYAVESGGISAGDIIWVRRTHAEYSGDPTSHITPAAAGNRNSHKSVIGWPRAAIPNTTITSATWTNGSTTVDLVVGVTLDREKHCGRWATAPNGKKFLITQITDSNTLIIDREYSGATVTLTNGKFQIEADEDYSDRPSDIDGWDSDADDLPVIDFRNTAYYIENSFFWRWKNLEIRDSNYTIGCMYLAASSAIGCLFHQDNDKRIIYMIAGYIDRSIFEGSSSGSSQAGISNATYPSVIKNTAIYNMGNDGLENFVGRLENVNIGVEAVNDGADIAHAGLIGGRDVKLGSTIKVDAATPEYSLYKDFIVKIENYQKILGDHKTFAVTQIISSKDVVDGSGDPYKRSGGADKIIEVNCQDSDGAAVPERAVVAFEHEFEAPDTASRSFRYYVQCKDLALSADELWLEVEYVDSYDDTSEYTITREESDEACTIRSGVSDWDQYIEVTGIQPAVASKIRIRCFVAKYDADGYIYIDPQTVVS